MRFFNWRLRALLFTAAIVVVSVGTASAQTGTVTDDRDGQTYKTTTIGKQTWMAQNLNYKGGKTWCYDDEEAKCKQYGRLYDWNAAKAACPSGWHLPSKDEWTELVTATGSDSSGKALKSKSGWENNGNGTDAFGFSALPGGFWRIDGNFVTGGVDGRWWTSTEATGGFVFCRNMRNNNAKVQEYNLSVNLGLSVRCVKD